MTSIQYNMSVIFENNKLKMKESVLTEEELQTYTELPNDDWLWNENENENENENPNPNVTDELSSPINDTLASSSSNSLWWLPSGCFLRLNCNAKEFKFLLAAPEKVHSLK